MIDFGVTDVWKSGFDVVTSISHGRIKEQRVANWFSNKAMR